MTPRQEPEDIAQKAMYAKLSTKLTLILLPDGSAFAYEGLDVDKGSVYTKAELRNVILKAKNHFPAKDFFVLIKTPPPSDYASTVDVLDEMTINKIDRYAMIEKLSPEEQNRVNAVLHRD